MKLTVSQLKKIIKEELEDRHVSTDVIHKATSLIRYQVLFNKDLAEARFKFWNKLSTLVGGGVDMKKMYEAVEILEVEVYHDTGLIPTELRNNRNFSVAREIIINYFEGLITER